MTLNVVLNYVVSAIDVALILFFTTKFLRKFNSDWKRILVVVAMQTCINNLLGEVIGDGNPLGLLAMIITTGILYKLVFREDIFAIYAFICLALITMFVAEGIAVLFLFVFGIMPTDMHTEMLPLILGSIISKTLYFVFVWHFIPKLRLYKSINKTVLYQVMLVSIFNIIIILMAFWFYKNIDTLSANGHGTNYIVLTTLGAIIFSLGILGITKGIITQSQKEAEWQLKENEYKRQMFYVENTQDMLKSINSQRHDFNNHINCLYGLLKLNKVKEAQEYIERLADELNEFNIVVDAGNPVLTALLNTKLMVAQREKVYMEAEVNLPEEMGIESIDLSIIMGNLLDNALEACKKVDNEHKYIEIDMGIKSSNLIIKICNSKSNDVKVDFSNANGSFTSKEDASNHGFGLNNIRQAVDKYHGIVKFEDNGEFFIANIAIPVSI